MLKVYTAILSLANPLFIYNFTIINTVVFTVVSAYLHCPVYLLTEKGTKIHYAENLLHKLLSNRSRINCPTAIGCTKNQTLNELRYKFGSVYILEIRIFAYAKTKTQISFAVTTKLISAFVFAIRIVQSLYYRHPKFQTSSHLLWLYRPVCVGSGRKPRRPVFSQRG